MEKKTDESFGVIPVVKNDDGSFDVFIINQINRTGGTFWGFPKGHPEGSETNEESALRELTEETGIIVSKLDTAHPFVQNYNFVSGEAFIEKTVTYYAGFASNRDFVVQEAEVAEAKWCGFTEARELLTHDNNKQMLDDLMIYLSLKT